MYRIFQTTLILLFVFITVPYSLQAQLRIMPMGNSITYDENSYDVPPHVRPVGDRISYRYRLYQLIQDAGYSFDFVGSEYSGNNYFQNPEMDDNAGFPGLDKEQLAYLLKYGKNLRTGQQITPGPYVYTYPADIILLHIGTNNLTADATLVSALLDNIRNYDSHVIILVARIINRMTYSSLTTTYNDNVENMVNARGDAKIIMVNMETGAGINYTSDMFDNLHPNTSGYNKMAAKWFEAIDNLNAAPEIAAIPEQSIAQGATAFTPLALDGFVSDAEDADGALQWTYRLQPGSKFSVSINASRQMNVTVSDISWYGSETITLKAKDSGSGAFQKTDSVNVIFTVIKGNEAPVITSTPPASINEDANFSYTITAIDNDGDNIAYSAPVLPAWLTFSAVTHTLNGKPTNGEVGVHSVQLRASDGKDNTNQSFQLTVVNTNDLPVITSIPVTTGIVGQAYLYEFSATDIDVGDILTYSAISLPSWLTLSVGSNVATISGIATIGNLGSNSVILKVGDGKADILQGYTINVTIGTATEENNLTTKNIFYPNPANNVLFFDPEGSVDLNLIIYNISGTPVKQITAQQTSNLEIDISDLCEGIYIIKAYINNQLFSGKLSILE